MSEDIKSFFSTMQNDFIAGRLEKMASVLSTPLVMYSPAGVVVVSTNKDVVHRISMYRQALWALSTSGGTCEILSQDPVVNKRLRVLLRSTYLTDDGTVTTSTVTRYFLMQTETSFLVEMIEYLEFPIPVDA